MKIHALYCVFTLDEIKKENLVISERDDKVLFPIVEIENPRYLHNEIHYNLQKLFTRTTYNPDILANINFTYMDIQNEFVYRYLEEKELTKSFDVDNDVFILCCAIIESPYGLDKYHWEKFKFIKSFTDMDAVNSIVDLAIEKSIL